MSSRSAARFASCFGLNSASFFASDSAGYSVGCSASDWADCFELNLAGYSAAYSAGCLGANSAGCFALNSARYLAEYSAGCLEANSAGCFAPRFRAHSALRPELFVPPVAPFVLRSVSRRVADLAADSAVRPAPPPALHLARCFEPLLAEVVLQLGIPQGPERVPAEGGRRFARLCF